jgi:hypothetical protein
MANVLCDIGSHDVVDDDIGAGLRESNGYGFADSRIGARHQRGLAGERRRDSSARERPGVRPA